MTAQQFALVAEATASIAERGAHVDAITREMGFGCVALAHPVGGAWTPQPAIHIQNYPPEGEAFFDAEELGHPDTVHRASHLRNLGFPWAMLRDLIELRRRDEEIIARSSPACLADGDTVPTHILGRSEGSCSFATAQERRHRMDWLPPAQFVGTATFEATRRLSAIQRTDADSPRLSDRQRACIHWAAGGKSERGKAQILGIGHGTAVQHMEARKRYGVFEDPTHDPGPL